MKFYKLLPLFFLVSLAHAQISATANPNHPLHLPEMTPANAQELAIIIEKEKIIGQKFSEKCTDLKNNETCIDNLKALIKIPNLTHMRIIRPNMPVTMDFSPNRVNITIDKNNIIRKVNIG